jgi:hypothetical protein
MQAPPRGIHACSLRAARLGHDLEASLCLACVRPLSEMQSFSKVGPLGPDPLEL